MGGTLAQLLPLGNGSPDSGAKSHGRPDLKRGDGRNHEKVLKKTNHRKDEFIHLTQAEREIRIAEILAWGVLGVIGEKEDPGG